jgi:hypothetical protein
VASRSYPVRLKSTFGRRLSAFECGLFESQKNRDHLNRQRLMVTHEAKSAGGSNLSNKLKMAVNIKKSPANQSEKRSTRGIPVRHGIPQQPRVYFGSTMSWSTLIIHPWINCNTVQKYPSTRTQHAKVQAIRLSREVFCLPDELDSARTAE